MANAAKIGVQFELIQGGGNPRLNEFAGFTNELYLAAISSAAGNAAPEDEGKVCPLMFDVATINHNGDASGHRLHQKCRGCEPQNALSTRT